MTIPRIDPNVKHCGVSEPRKLNREKLRDLPAALLIQDNGEPLAVIVSFEMFLRMQEEREKIGTGHE